MAGSREDSRPFLCFVLHIGAAIQKCMATANPAGLMAAICSIWQQTETNFQKISAFQIHVNIPKIQLSIFFHLPVSTFSAAAGQVLKLSWMTWKAFPR